MKPFKYRLEYKWYKRYERLIDWLTWVAQGCPKSALLRSTCFECLRSRGRTEPFNDELWLKGVVLCRENDGASIYKLPPEWCFRRMEQFLSADVAEMRRYNFV